MEYSKPNNVFLGLDNQWFKVVKVKSSIRKLYDRHHELINRYGISVSMNDHRFVTFVDSNPVLSAFMTYLQTFDNCKTTDATAYQSRVLELIPGI